MKPYTRLFVVLALLVISLIPSAAPLRAAAEAHDVRIAARARMREHAHLMQAGHASALLRSPVAPTLLARQTALGTTQARLSRTQRLGMLHRQARVRDPAFDPISCDGSQSQQFLRSFTSNLR